MQTQWLDWLTVGIVVVGAVIWLTVYYRRKWVRKRDRSAASDACGGGCDGCRYSKDCSTNPD